MMRTLLRRYRKAILCTALFVLSFAAGKAISAGHSPLLDQTLDRTASGEMASVILFLDHRLTMEDLYPTAVALAMTERREYVVSSLEERFADMSKDVMADLQLARENGQVELLRPLWIVNAIRLRALPEVIRREENLRHEIVYIACDPLYDNTLDNIGWGLRDIAAPRVWTSYGVNGAGVIVGHKDSGVNASLPGFQGRFWLNPGEDVDHNGSLDSTSEINGIDDDGNGYVDDFYGWNFDNDDNNVNDRDGHGTRTASVVSADFVPCAGSGPNDTTSVVPGARLMILSGYQYQGAVWEASQYALMMGAQVLTASLSFKQSDCNGQRECPNYVVHRMVSEMELAAGIIHSNSTGNEGLSNPPPLSAAAPSNCPPPAMTPAHTQQGGLSSIVAVTAYNQDGSFYIASGRGPSGWSREDICVNQRSPFCSPDGLPGSYPSFYNDYPFHDGQPGLAKPDICAPTSVLSLFQGGGCASIGGTSGATPHVGGVLALIYAAFPGITPEAAYLLLTSGAQDAGAAGFDNDWGFGKLRAMAACSLGFTALGNLHGVVSGPSGPLEGVRITADGANPVISNSVGAYTFWLSSGNHEIHFEKYGMDDETETVSVVGGQVTLHNVTLTAAALASVDAHTVGITPGGTVTLSNISVTIPELGLSGVTGEDGTVSFGILYTGRYVVYAESELWAKDSVNLIVTAELPNVAEFALHPSSVTLPVGPDNYGYRIWDNLDTPWVVFDWVEINPAAGGLEGVELPPGEDVTNPVDLPFLFRFYGTDYSSLSINANGFIMMGTASSSEWGYVPIPSSLAPDGFLAPAFMDWSPLGGSYGQMFTYDDAANHRFFVEWYNVSEYYANALATFEVIFYDPDFYPTSTGDGSVAFQYLTIMGRAEASVGLESPDGMDGLQYSFQTIPDPNAAPIETGRILFITTDSLTAAQEPPVPSPREFAIESNYPNPFNPSTTFVWTMPHAARVRIALFDLLGREAAVIVAGSYDAGRHSVVFDGSRLASGMYFARLESEGQMLSLQKVMLLR